MLIATNNIPRKMGMSLQLEVDPMNSKEVPAFSVEAEVVRLIEDRQFAVRFRSLPEDVLKAIEAFL